MSVFIYNRPNSWSVMSGHYHTHSIHLSVIVCLYSVLKIYKAPKMIPVNFPN